MNFLVVQRILGLLLMLFSLTMLPPIGVSLHFNDGNWQPFFDAFVALLVVGFIAWWPVRRKVRELRLRDGFLVVALFWVVLGIAGSVPLYLSAELGLTLTDAVFEAMSGFTTTGAIIFPSLDNLPESVLYYRSQVEWLGGIGIVVLAVALLPMLGVGGMQLLRAETPGPVKDSKLTPRITETAKALWIIYLGITVACALAYWAAGMRPFDAVAHAFTTVSTGGNSTHDASIAYFDNAVIEGICVIFMFIGGINFSLHFLAWRHRRLSDYFRDPEFGAFIRILGVSIALYTLVLWITRFAHEPGEAFRLALFHAVSMQTTSGFVTDDFTHWPGALPVIIVLSAFIGGCAGSTSGGMKIVRWLLILKQGQREVNQLVHPSAELPVKLGRKPMDMRVIDAVWGFFAVYVIAFGILMIALLATGEDQVTAFSAIAACMTNTGTGLGEVARNFTSLTDGGKWICVLAMLLGRLEVFPLLVLISPTFWRR
ncbi:MAG TPA: TrkH family potassium uptake protein [Povalibacter sp.]|uniref:TrkH family potassium uptake protein n=1 Tax=Povalibacter sp. TaxID=1962978 RepID=UPI002C88E40C|nr:TrkH family potassium uptake protein [Povalibacter sp.]HMN44710.1 TrkH family potassium uptake protein [Povalibacter sp.]